jgi:GTP-binding protein
MRNNGVVRWLRSATAYKSYLVDSLRETFDLPGTPIRLTLREKANPFAGRRKR